MPKTKIEILETLDKKKNALQKLLPTRNSKDPALFERDCQKKAYIEDYLSELEEIVTIISSLEENSSFSIVSQSTFETQSKKADFCNIEFDGFYCRFEELLYYAFSNKKIYCIYLYPVSKVI